MPNLLHPFRNYTGYNSGVVVWLAIDDLIYYSWTRIDLETDSRKVGFEERRGELVLPFNSVHLEQLEFMVD